jgi:branched-chain amino acid transport system permease protein
MASFDTIIVVLLQGLSSGFLLFLAASGLTLIFGGLGILNFAHGSFYMLGAYAMFFLIDITGQFWLALLFAPLVVAIFGAVVELLVIRRIYDHDHIFQLLLTFALVLVIDNAVRIVWGTDFRSVTTPPSLSATIDVLGRSIPVYNLFIIVAGAAVGVALWLGFKRTRFGKIIRASAEDREMVQMLGINVPVVFTLVFLGGTALAGLGGALTTPVTSIAPSMGESIIIESFIVVIIGGMGSYFGAFVGAIMIGLLNAAAFIYIPQLQPIIPFLLAGTILFVRPNGLFGTEATL